MEFTLEEILEAAGAKVLKNTLKGDAKFTFSTDTRTIKQGQIYLPLKGENFDGENFIEQALEVGAVGYFCTGNQNFEKAKLILQVTNTIEAYFLLARFYRRKINPKTVAITGSSGKTTTKEMAYCVAQEKFKTHKSELNFNNEIGLCKTILSMPEDTEVLILEMGMRGLGEIELLSKYSEPDIAVIANVGTAHIGRLGSRENIAKAKCEILTQLRENGTLIAHDDELIRLQSEKYKVQNVHYFSLDDAHISNRQIGHSEFEYKNHEYGLNIEGDYNVQNSLAVIEMGLLLGMSDSEIESGLKKYSPIEKRWEVQEIKGYKIINDSYNANPESMKGILKTVLDVYEPPILFVLGDMGELGDDEIKYHKEIGDFLANNLKDNVGVLTVGKLTAEITDIINAAGAFSQNFETNLQTSRYILDNIKVGTTIVLKASRSMKFEEIIEYLKSDLKIEKSENTL